MQQYAATSTPVTQRKYTTSSCNCVKRLQANCLELLHSVKMATFHFWGTERFPREPDLMSMGDGKDVLWQA